MLKKIEIYTDGACSFNPGPGGWAAILFYKESKKEISGGESETTNNRMELTAVIKGLEALKEKCEVTVYSDSAYVVNAVSQGWLKAWLANGYRTAQKKEIANKDLWISLNNLMQKHSVLFKKVEGHSDNEFNNRCDFLAREEIKKFL